MAQDGKIDVLQERLELYRLQKKRVQLDTDIEQKLKKTFPSLNQDLRLLREMLTDVDDIQNSNAEHFAFPDL